MKRHYSKLGARLLCGAAAVAILSGAGMAQAEERAQVRFDIPAQPLTAALNQFGIQSGSAVLFKADVTGAKLSKPLTGAADPEMALAMMLDGTGLSYRREGQAFVIVSASDPQSASAAGDGADQGTVAALIVTAQKREENIQDVPIAMSAFSQEDLTRSQVATGADLMTQVPNMTFTKTNFTSYSIQIRGIGTQAISATVDPAVAVAFNNTPFLRAHFFEQEFYDLERVEVLRGPQGTLYGRNATAGVVNLISAKPKFHFEAKASADVSNYSSHRIEGMLNLPLVEDKVALRIAGAWTKRDGFVTNENTGKQTDGRNLWSTRLSLRIDPTERLRTNFIWEHFEEDDDRLRSGKQTCKRSETPAAVLGIPTTTANGGQLNNGVIDPARYLNQGCDPASIYSPDAFQVPNGISLPYYLPLGELGGPSNGNATWDVYANTTQSRDLRVIQTQVEPHYRADSDTVELNVDYAIAPGLTLSSQTGYNRDFLFSTQDYNRFNTRPGAFCASCVLFSSSQQIFPGTGQPVFGFGAPPDQFGLPCDPDVDGATCRPPDIFCDPQIGCSDRVLVVDLATAHSAQFSQEFRIASDFDGRFNFSLGANYMRYKTLEDYYVFVNTITATLLGNASNFLEANGLSTGPWVPGVSDNSGCLVHGYDSVILGFPYNPQVNTCGYIDPNPMGSLNGQGHNYFRNQNPYKLQSYAVFGEAYYDVTPELKLTAGLRWTVDKKHFVSIPSEVLVQGYGYPAAGEFDQEWREPTGRLVLTWKPDFSFTDESMLYGSYTHGYKAGGANPPGAVLLVNRGGDIPFPTHPARFDPEFVNSYEIGTKNTLLDGKLTADLTSFYYDYTGYQISEIVDRSAINLNYDAKIWGVELETDWRPLQNLRFGLKLGYEDTRVADDQSAVDLIDRTAGHPGWMVVKPFPTQASNCIIPEYVVAALLYQNSSFTGAQNACTNAYLAGVDPVTSVPYGEPMPGFLDPPPADYPGFDPSTAPNLGTGFSKDLSGNALPNAPHWTSTLTADYTLPLPHDWLMTLHTDLYRQSEAWTRIFNDPGFDKLKAYTNVNLAAIFTNENAGWTVMTYVKNVFDKDNITGAFLNSDDTGLTNNVFLNEPRLYGIRVTKSWSDSPWWSAHANKSGEYPFRIEVEGYHGSMRGGHDAYLPGLNLTSDHVDLFPTDLEFPTGIQNDLSAGNGGGIKFTYQPVASSWSIAAATRYGRTGGGTHRFKAKDLGESCVYNGLSCRYPSEIPADAQFWMKYGWHSFYETTTANEESHAFADFTVGKNLGIGRIKSTVSVGLAYARFKSASEAVMRGTPDMYFPANGVVYDSTGYHKYHVHSHRFNDTVRSERDFQGGGPELNWDSQFKLAGDPASAGQVDLDLGMGGTVLFGRQKTEFSGQLTGSYRSGGNVTFPIGYTTSSYNLPVGIAPRSKKVTVPGLRANLGLSYSLGGLKVSGGYRVERYYNAIDGGIQERNTYDRSFDGPYMKVSIGFGG